MTENAFWSHLEDVLRLREVADWGYAPPLCLGPLCCKLICSGISCANHYCEVRREKWPLKEETDYGIGHCVPPFPWFIKGLYSCCVLEMPLLYPRKMNLNSLSPA